MECVVQVTQGDKLNKFTDCIFCLNKAESAFCITKGEKYNGTILSFFGVCELHKDKLNALLSGEFDIDQIYLDKYSICKENLNLRRHPPIGIAKTIHKKSRKQCSASGCTNYFFGIVNQKYCNDIRCKEQRKELTKKVKRTKLCDPDAKNIILHTKKYSKFIQKGQALKIRCRATDKSKNRCKNTFLITYDPKQKVYPMFCENHRSAYKRTRFQERA